MDGIDGYIVMWIYLMPQNSTFEMFKLCILYHNLGKLQYVDESIFTGQCKNTSVEISNSDAVHQKYGANEGLNVQVFPWCLEIL